MKLKIVLDSEHNIFLPLHYNRILQNFIYHNLGSTLSSFFHDYGFPVGKRLLKPLTFSRIYGHSVINKVAKKIIFKPPVYFYFSSLFPDVLSNYTGNLIKRSSLRLGKNEVHLVNMIPVEEKFLGDEVILKTLSPVVVRRTVEKKSVFYSPDDREFYDLIKKNLAKKTLLYSEKAISVDSFEILPADDAKFKKVVALYKGFPIVGYKGKFVLKAPREVIETALLAGIGEKNSQGFGMVILDRRESFQ